jgi:DNA-binding IclR family transcriptional regulator
MIKLLLNAPLEHLRCKDIDNVIKLLHVLEYICRAKNDCSVSAIVSNVDVDKSQISKWLEAFVESGYINKDEKTDLYYPTLKTTTLGNCIVNNIRARKFTSAEIKKRCSSVELFTQLSTNGINDPGKIGGIE